jgi:stage II sporulation protein D
LELEEYLRGVLAGEASVEDQLEALKAQAVTSRTFALKNLGRHVGEGYDFCSLTHCQRFVEVGDVKTRASEAVKQTAGEILQDERGRLAEVYYHAACGGMTANLETLWGTASPSYLRGVRDDYCAARPNRRWTEEISQSRLVKALSSDSQTNVGARVDDVVITKRDATGRAEEIMIEGERRRRVRGWDFKQTVSRALGWNVLKSSRFEVVRRGRDFVFRGSGLGHGLGLCQQGAHVMAERGASYRQILDHYFPDTSVGPPSQRRLSLSSENFRASYPPGLQRSEIEQALDTLEKARADLAHRLANASLSFSERLPIDVVIHATTQEFVAATGQPWWVAGATRARRIQLQPIGALRRRRSLTPTLRHEYAHAVIEELGQGRAPRWLAEGLAIHFAGEGARFGPVKAKAKIAPDELERRLERPASAEEMRLLYGVAYGLVRALIEKDGEASVWQRVVKIIRE